MEIVIRNADFRHFEKELIELYKRAYSGWSEYAFRSDRKIHYYLRWLRKRCPEGFLIAFADGKPVGFIAVDYNWVGVGGKRVGELHELAVDPEFQNQGIGTKLVLAGMDVLRAKGHKRFELWVGYQNDKAISLYKKLGFKSKELWDVWIRMTKDEE